MHRRNLLRSFVVAATLLTAALSHAAVGPGGAHASPPNGWRLQTHLGGDGIHTALLDISCASRSLCVSVGEPDRVVSSTKPTDGAGSWGVVQPEGAADTDCHAYWIPPCRDPKLRILRGVSCPSSQLCVAVTGDGYIYSTTNPTGPGSAWQVADIDGDGRDIHLMSVSCPTTTLCVAVSGERANAGQVLWSRNPNGGAASWNATQLDESLDLRGVSCGTARFCLAVADDGRMHFSTDPTGGASAWKSIGTPGGSGGLQGVSCATTILCVAGNEGGNLLASINPDLPASWLERSGGGRVLITGVSCLPSRQCLAVDNNGNVLTTDDPTRGQGAWSLVNLLPYIDPETERDYPFNALFGVSCPSSTFCAISGADGRIFTNSDPFSNDGVAKAHSKSRRRRPKRPRTIIALARAGSRVRNRHMKSPVLMRFHANGKVRGFRCSRDKRGFRPCHSPVRYRVGIGKHIFRVRAIGVTGLKGPVAFKKFVVEVNPNLHR